MAEHGLVEGRATVSHNHAGVQSEGVRAGCYQELCLGPLPILGAMVGRTIGVAWIAWIAWVAWAMRVAGGDDSPGGVCLVWEERQVREVWDRGMEGGQEQGERRMGSRAFPALNLPRRARLPPCPTRVGTLLSQPISPRLAPAARTDQWKLQKLQKLQKLSSSPVLPCTRHAILPQATGCVARG